MARVILLSGAHADNVRGPSAESPSMATLQPVALTDGRYILGVEVLSDPAHADVRDYLAALPTADAAEIAGLLPQTEHG